MSPAAPLAKTDIFLIFGPRRASGDCGEGNCAVVQTIAPENIQPGATATPALLLAMPLCPVLCLWLTRHLRLFLKC